jgi:hypothetical protein
MGGVEGLPFTQLASEEPVAGLAHATPAYIVKDCLRNLKMGFWPWEWSPKDSYGFVNAAQAALGQVRGTLGLSSPSSSNMEPRHVCGRPALEPEKVESQTFFSLLCPFNESAHAQLSQANGLNLATGSPRCVLWNSAGRALRAEPRWHVRAGQGAPVRRRAARAQRHGAPGTDWRRPYGAARLRRTP